MNRSSWVLLLFVIDISRTSSFQHSHTSNTKENSKSKPGACSQTCCSMLTERQIQFWEDVDNGLDEIENFYAKKGQNIDRIRTFSKRARGDLPPPEGCSPGHEPSEEYIDGLTAKPFWDVSDNPDLFPWASELESKSDIIQRELENNLLSPAQLFKADSAVSETMGNGWSALRLQRLGKYTENVQLFPNTYQVIKKLEIPLAVRGVCFARQAGSTGVSEHSKYCRDSFLSRSQASSDELVLCH